MRESLFSRDGVVSAEDVRNAQTEQLTAAARLDEAKANSAVAKSAGQSVELADDALTIQERKVGAQQQMRILQANGSEKRHRCHVAEVAETVLQTSSAHPRDRCNFGKRQGVREVMFNISLGTLHVIGRSRRLGLHEVVGVLVAL